MQEDIKAASEITMSLMKTAVCIEPVLISFIYHIQSHIDKGCFSEWHGLNWGIPHQAKTV